MNDKVKQELKEESIYLVYSKDFDENGNRLVEISQYRKNRFWFFGWEVPEPIDKFEYWEELVFSKKE